jgi:hypothetical protein
MNHSTIRSLSMTSALALSVGCTSPEDNEDPGATSTHGDGPNDTSAADDTSGGTPVGCADPQDASARQALAAEITSDTTLSCDTVWVLQSPVFVRGATLSIEAGTTLLGAAGSALVIDSDSRIEAVGTADAPIVMTSVLAPGERNRGDWGGLVLLGKAPNNLDGGVGQAEGFANPPSYGGDEQAHDCGTLSYLRVEWAGFELAAGSELNGITFYSCGTQTHVDHVQVHMGQDDGLEMFGGEFDLDHIVVTGAADDSIDCDEGFRGRLQYVLIQQDPQLGDNALEWSNQGVDFVADPRTGPVLANATIIGSGAGGDKSKGVTLKEGTHGSIYNSVFIDATNEAVLLTHQPTQAAAQAGDLVLAGNLFFRHGGFAVDEGVTWTAEDLSGWIMNGNLNAESDPQLPSVAWGSPNVAPPASSPAATVQALTASGLEPTTFAGAVDPNGTDWTQEPWIVFGR